jgi:signal transduction histidine kinase
MSTIRGRLLAMLLAGLTATLAAGGTAVYLIARASMQRQLDAELTTRAMGLASLVTFDDGRVEFEYEKGETETIGDWFEFRTADGAVARRADRLDETAFAARADVGDEPVFDDVTLPGGVSGRAVWLRFRPRIDPEDQAALAALGIEVEPMVVVAAVERGPLDRALATLLVTLAVVGATIAVTVAAIVLVGVRWGLRPIGRLTGQLGSVGGATLSRRIDAAGAPAELLPIYHELNRMLDRVEATIERERSFANAAAHELRTPLAELRTTAEVALKWPDLERATASLIEALGIGREMERLVESLLLLSRGNTEAVERAKDEVVMAGIVRGCLERSADAINEKRLTLTVDVDDGRPLRAPRDAVEIIVRNLIENAVQYTPSDGRISISANGAPGDAPELIVANDPVPLDASDVPRLFEPFWRQEGARSDRNHAGLGLAVVRQIAGAVGLHVDARLADDRLQVRLSAAADAAEGA